MAIASISKIVGEPVEVLDQLIEIIIRDGEIHAVFHVADSRGKWRREVVRCTPEFEASFFADQTLMSQGGLIFQDTYSRITGN